ncbi:hypothetical protein DFP72DRAFT_1091823 [Ephemerocybe angulata]|uniref:Uncharacterized protein n=1 Tax=Ephemerocybe angulata TaxID=980116 RepID=A0A8H6LWF2_9AGAR|nr:hypothetical protein DFP72DRAFT_1091823 [Tulosesus angulatus]
MYNEEQSALPRTTLRTMDAYQKGDKQTKASSVQQSKRRRIRARKQNRERKKNQRQSRSRLSDRGVVSHFRGPVRAKRPCLSVHHRRTVTVVGSSSSRSHSNRIASARDTFASGILESSPTTTAKLISTSVKAKEVRQSRERDIEAGREGDALIQSAFQRARGGSLRERRIWLGRRRRTCGLGTLARGLGGLGRGDGTLGRPGSAFLCLEL